MNGIWRRAADQNQSTRRRRNRARLWVSRKLLRAARAGAPGHRHRRPALRHPGDAGDGAPTCRCCCCCPRCPSTPAICAPIRAARCWWSGAPAERQPADRAAGDVTGIAETDRRPGAEGALAGGASLCARCMPISAISRCGASARCRRCSSAASPAPPRLRQADLLPDPGRGGGHRRRRGRHHGALQSRPSGCAAGDRLPCGRRGRCGAVADGGRGRGRLRPWLRRAGAARRLVGAGRPIRGGCGPNWSGWPARARADRVDRYR